jgi:tRNA pseudouridine38-40 synthase
MGASVERCVRLIVAYDGTGFSGWQYQPQRRTVQGVLEQAVARIAPQAERAVASGRTDAGVHALAQAVSLRLHTRLDNGTLQRALNAYLPEDVQVLSVDDAPRGFHAIDDARGKRYRYVIDDGIRRDLFSRQHAWFVRQRLDVGSMQRAARWLIGQHDFRSFQSAGSPRVSTVRTVRDVSVERRPYQSGERVLIEIEADGFLYNMVRNVVGTLVEVGRGRQGVDWPAAVLAAGDRCQAGMTAPAHGLYLLRVYFDF